jgi:hypothetical protein
LARINKPNAQVHSRRTQGAGGASEINKPEAGETQQAGETAAEMTTGQVRREGALPEGSEQVHTGAMVSVRNTVLTEKDKKQMRPGVPELYGTYNIGERLGRPRERVLTWTAFLQGKLEDAAKTDDAKPATAGDVAKFAVDNDLRRQIFLLEGMLKLYDGPYPELKVSYAKVKMLEDAIGQVTGAHDLKETADTVANLPDGAKHWVETNIADAEKKLEQVISGNLDPEQKKAITERLGLPDDADIGPTGFMAGDNGQIPVFGEMIDLMANADWDSTKKDKKFLMKEIRGRLDEIDDTDYDMADLQGATGLHEFRRDVRWLPIFAEALDGLVELDPKHNPIKEYEKLLITDPNDPDFVTDLSASKFVRLPESDLDKKPIKFSLSLYTANMKAVLDFGKLKDRGEAIENIAHALVHGGDAKDLDEAMPKAMDLLGMPRDSFDSIIKEAETMYGAIRMHDLIDELEDELK